MSKYSNTYYLKEKTEDTEQMQIINYCNSMSAYVQEYAMIYHIPNEGKRKNTGGFTGICNSAYSGRAGKASQRQRNRN